MREEGGGEEGREEEREEGRERETLRREVVSFGLS